jgi:hypothetical protein
MYDGSRVTDAVDYWKRREELKRAVGIVRARQPERFRWRKAIASVSESTGPLRGITRARIEEPIREIVLDLSDDVLKREIIIDARRAGVDLDRGEVLPRKTLAEIRMAARAAGIDLTRVGRHLRLPDDGLAMVDLAGVLVVGRALGDHFRNKAQRLMLSVPDPDGPEQLRLHHRILLERAASERSESQRWYAFARSVLETPPVLR